MTTATLNGKPRQREITGEQILVTSGVDGRLVKALPTRWTRKVRDMRRDPTIGFIRDLYLAPMLAAEWTVVSDRPRFKIAEEFLLNQFAKRRRKIIRDVIRGLLDFGWQPFEMVHDYNVRSGKIELTKMKPLLQDMSDILVNMRGDLIGVRNTPNWPSNYKGAGPWVDIYAERQCVFYRDVEGTNWYGEALMRRVEGPYDAWNTAEASAQRFDAKIAGAVWSLGYPPGKSMWRGVMTDNFEIAKDIIESIKAGGNVIMPREVAAQIDDLNSLAEDKLAWKLELISASGSSESSFVGRQKYIDALKARGIGIPERAIFEGQFGTKAEAEAHADFAIDNIEMGHLEVVERLNETECDFLLEVNYGEEFKGRVRLQPSPLSDARKAQLRNLYTQYLGTQDGSAEETERLDWAAITDELGYPTRLTPKQAEAKAKKEAADKGPEPSDA